MDHRVMHGGVNKVVDRSPCAEIGDFGDWFTPAWLGRGGAQQRSMQLMAESHATRQRRDRQVRRRGVETIHKWSCAGRSVEDARKRAMTRASIVLRKSVRGRMDCRVKPAMTTFAGTTTISPCVLATAAGM
jgi:hypothetical protein